MTICTLSPSPKQYFFDPLTGEPLANGFVYTYAAGTSTPATTYQDAFGASANLNPIQLNGFGYCTIFLPLATSFKYVVTTSLGVIVWTQDNISAVPPSSANLDISGLAGEAIAAGAPAYLSDGSGSKNAGQWYNAANTMAYSSTTPEIGFAVAAVSSGAIGSFRQAGVLTGLAGLVTGALYYIGSAGTITTTVGANARFVGQADSTTSLVVSPNPAQQIQMDIIQVEVFT